MINLLSDVKKNEIRAARANTILFRYILVLIAAGLFIAGIIYVSYQSLKQSETSATEQLALIGVPGSQGQQANAESLMSAVSATVAQQGTKTSQLLTRLAQTLPQNTFVRSLTLSSQNPQEKSVTLIIHAKKGTTPESIRTALGAAGLISQLTVRSSSTNSKDVANYPVKVELSGLISGGIQQQGGPLL